MAFTTWINIFLVRASAEGPPAAGSEPFFASLVYTLIEQPFGESPIFTLQIQSGGTEKQVTIDSEEGRQLTALLGRLPAKEMIAREMSLDGVNYEVVDLRRQPAFSYRWKNEDWQLDPNDSPETWQPVVSLVEFLEALYRKPSIP